MSMGVVGKGRQEYLHNRWGAGHNVAGSAVQRVRDATKETARADSRVCAWTE